jgi:glycosyltransferase involved in cell wall biosynthesis
MATPTPNRPRRIVVGTPDVLSGSRAGPAIRAFHIAERLAQQHDVVLASAASCDLVDDRFVCRTAIDSSDWRQLDAWCDVLVLQGALPQLFPFLQVTDTVIVADLYDPFHLEQLELLGGEAGPKQTGLVARSVRILNDQLARADFVLCASERQRLFWLGHLSALQRINPATYTDDPTLERLIAVVPFGLPDAPPARTGPGPRSSMAGIGSQDDLLLWAGGVYDWLDPCTVIRAIAILQNRRPQVRLVFMGGRHPNPDTPSMKALGEAEQLADRLGLLGTHVFFNQDWVPYGERQNFLLDADIGVSAHHRHAETSLAFRARILDYLWAGLPIVCTGGDVLADLVEAHKLGAVVTPGDEVGMAAALADLLDDRARLRRCAAASTQLAVGYRWSKVLDPLVQFVATAAPAPDRGARRERLRSNGPRLEPWRSRVDTLARQYRAEGWWSTALLATRRARRRL